MTRGLEQLEELHRLWKRYARRHGFRRPTRDGRICYATTTGDTLELLCYEQLPARDRDHRRRRGALVELTRKETGEVLRRRISLEPLPRGRPATAPIRSR